MTVKEIKDVLTAHGLRYTKQREAIIHTLQHNDPSLISAEDILNQVIKENPNLNLTTVYRTLDLLKSLNLVDKITNEEGLSHYKISCAIHHHHHIICTQCGKTEMIDFCPMNTLAKLSEDKGFALTNHRLELYGLCSRCRHHHTNPS